MTTIYTQITFCLWLLIGIVWFVGFFGNKKTTQLPNRKEQTIANILIILGAFFTFNTEATGLLSLTIIQPSIFVSTLGVLICALAVAFAIWARLSIGRNWSGAVITLKADHKLIQTGPYKFVRHPIYTGFFFAALGVALTTGTISSYVGALLMLIAFLIRIQKEEVLMTAQFPTEYPMYKKGSKALIPFLW